MSKVLITGGSGFLGTELVNYFLDHDHEINILDRYPSTEKNAQQFIGNIQDRRLLAEAIDGCDVVIHCLAEVPSAKNKSAFIGSNIDAGAPSDR